MPDLSILIVSFNTRGDLERCLASLHDAPPVISHEIVVIDNASTDGSVDAVRTRWPTVRVIRLEANVGFARANNAGFRATAGGLVLLLNSDTIVPPGAIDRLVGQMGMLANAAVVGPRLVDESGKPELSFGRMISPLAEVRQKYAARSAARVGALTALPREVDWVSGACLLVRRSAAEAAGYLDERYFMYTEDVDFCAAIRARGGRVYFSPLAEVIHLGGRSRATRPAETEAAYRRSHIAFYEKHHPGWAPILKIYLALRRQLPPPPADK